MQAVRKRSGPIAGVAVIAVLVLAAAFVIKPDRDAGIRAVITAQIEAFKRDDGEAAFAIAAPEIQAKFGNARSFMTMVAATYPQAYQPQRVDFLDVIEADGHYLQSAWLIDSDGNDALAVFSLVQVHGDWRISGCSVAEPPGEAI